MTLYIVSFYISTPDSSNLDRFHMELTQIRINALNKIKDLSQYKNSYLQ